MRHWGLWNTPTNKGLDARGVRTIGRVRPGNYHQRKLAKLVRRPQPGIVLNEHYEGYGEIIFRHACKLGCEGIVSKRLGSLYRSGRSPHRVKVKNPNAPAVKREAEEDWGR
jgi:bifunctional non-homologous end joining protein LigD